jgi:maltodextrin utilization protein YvdJ
MFIDFLNSLFVPSKIQRHSRMSALISILIFGLTVVILVIPFKTTIKNSDNDLLYSENLDLMGYYELDNSDFDYSQITEGEYKVVDAQMISTFEDDQSYKQYTVSYINENNRTVNVHIVFDVYSNRDRMINETLELYDKLYKTDKNSTDEAQNKKTYVALLSYIATVKDTEVDINSKIEELQGKAFATVEEDFKKITYFDYYNIPVNTEVDDYLIIYNKSYMDYQTRIYDDEGNLLDLPSTRLSVMYYDGFTFDIKEYPTVSDLGQKVADTRVDVEKIRSEQQYVIGAFVVVFLYSIIIVLIFWLFFRRRGAFTKFKEYYNIAAISSIAPTLISFVLLWFIPDAITLYGVAFSIFYVFVLYRINKIVGLKDPE